MSTTTLEDTLQTPEVIKTIESSPAPPSYRIEIFTQSDLLKQPFLFELRDVINTSYYDTGASSFEKTGARLQSNTQLADELQPTGFTAIAFAQKAIIGTASLKVWPPDAEGTAWKVPGYFERFSADEIFSASSTVLDIRPVREVSKLQLSRSRRILDIGGKGIAASLVKACHEELNRRMFPARSCIMLKCIREVQGLYWLKRGFRVVGEQYCPPYTWGYNKGFVLWAMERE
ncbi:hypothetical protein N7530_009260 [Penicillium desertorum]|uniref:Uncharacterized protein n=1 Tax=Penicillium desertorum TaxID=1303715 RepID=A0A9W9WI54_9EURO|nr:hypothetical protein N7530_009260 [Penicillium desertorum]